LSDALSRDLPRLLRDIDSIQSDRVTSFLVSPEIESAPCTDPQAESDVKTWTGEPIMLVP